MFRRLMLLLASTLLMLGVAANPADASTRTAAASSAASSASGAQFDPAPYHPCNASHDGQVIQDEFGRWQCKYSNGAWRWVPLDLPCFTGLVKGRACLTR